MCQISLKPAYKQISLLVLAAGMASMAEVGTAIYFRRLADRCLALSEECFELRAKEELRKLAEELAAEANAVEREQNSSVGTAHGAPHRG
jgi:hypothetical protein